jgi:transposase
MTKSGITCIIICSTSTTWRYRGINSWEEKIEGMLLVETTDMLSPAKDIICKYKELTEIERGWRSLKSTLLIRPVYQ